MLVWAWTLTRLYKDIKHSEKLLPNKRIFVMHGSILTAYLLLRLVVIVLIRFMNHENDLATFEVMFGALDLLLCFIDVLDVAAFLLVVKMMLPIT
jgi:hypothetical protein